MRISGCRSIFLKTIFQYIKGVLKLYTKVRVFNCSVVDFDYAPLIDTVVDWVQCVFGSSEWHIVKDAQGMLWVVSEGDLLS